MKQSELELAFLYQLKVTSMPPCETEYRFADSIGRKWRFDCAWPELMVAVELEGGTWVRGRHTRGSGFEKDCEKYNWAARLGWTVYRFTTSMVDSGEAIGFFEDALREIGAIE
jgi:very-short-patch-repair endonuclease